MQCRLVIPIAMHHRRKQAELRRPTLSGSGRIVSCGQLMATSAAPDALPLQSPRRKQIVSAERCAMSDSSDVRDLIPVRAKVRVKGEVGWRAGAPGPARVFPWRRVRLHEITALSL